MALGSLVLRLETLDQQATATLLQSKTAANSMSFIQRSERAEGGALNPTLLKHCKESYVAALCAFPNCLY
jgi:capsid protein